METPDGFLPEFERKVGRMAADGAAEDFVRRMIAALAVDCPINVLAGMAMAVIECRREELRREAEQNGSA